MSQKSLNSTLNNIENKTNFINVSGKLGQEEICNLFKSHSSKICKDILEKIDIFVHNMEFFEFYSDGDIKNLLNILKLKLPENNEEFISLVKSDIEDYISCISLIILSIKLFLKTEIKLEETVAKVINNMSKLKFENKIKNYDQDNLFLYLESLLKISEKNYKSYLSASALLYFNISSLEVAPKNILYPTFSNEYKIKYFSNDEKEVILNDNQSTPKFKFDFEKQEKINFNLENSTQDNFSIKTESIFTLSKYIFDEEPTTSKNTESKFVEFLMDKTKMKKNFKNEYDNKQKITSSETDINIKKNNKNYCLNLLEMIKKIYKKGLINSEEKVKLKQLVIDKSKKIEYLYYNVYKNSKNDKKMIISEVKKILN